MKRRRRTRSERGSASIEAAVGVPAFLLIVGLIIFAARTSTTHDAVQAAAAEAARTASEARSSTEASASAQTAAESNLANQDIHCLSVTVKIDVSTFPEKAGIAGTVTATVACRVDLLDLSVPGIPDSRLVSATASSPVDTYTEKE